MRERSHRGTGRLSVLLLAAVLLPAAARAAAPVGSITVQLNAAHYAGASVSGVGTTLWRVADRVGEGYVPVPDCKNSGADLGQLHNAGEQAAAAKVLADFLAGAQIAGVSASTDSAGKAYFPNLDGGLYLLKVADCPGGTTAPFLVALPLGRPDGTGWLYDVTAEPKGNPYPEDPPTTPPPKVTPTPTPTPQVTPSPTPEVTPTPTPEVTQTPVPEATPAPTPEVTPSPAPSPTPTPGDGGLPQTGQHGPGIWLCAAGGLLLVTGGTARLYGDKKKGRHGEP
ncbi:MAG: hypothetical protein RR211_02650 [Pseudoflavonifractor sp.]